jgi:hypothetical protein
LTDTQAGTLCEALSSDQGKTVTTLQAQNNSLTTAGALKFATMMQTHPRLTTLYLGRNEIKDAGSFSLAVSFAFDVMP